VGGFVDPLVDCKTCKGRFRADKMQDATCGRKPSKQPGQHSECELTEARQFNLMFKTQMGAVEDSSATIYLRPETAQGSYVNFLNVQQSTRQKVPFGIAQIGKAFRNEITPGNFIFRTREFEQMEMQFFVEPGTDMEHFERWKAERMAWHQSLGLAPARLQYHVHGPDELAHYARAAFDIEFDFGGTLGFQEIEGIHNRGDFDLGKHQEFSGKRLEYVDQANNKRYLPYVIETLDAAGDLNLPQVVTSSQFGVLQLVVGNNPASQEHRNSVSCVVPYVVMIMHKRMRVRLLPVEIRDVKGAGAGDDVVIQNASAKIDRPTDAQIAFIEPHGGFGDMPMMPQLEASIPGGPANLDVEWSLEVKWNRGNGAVLPEDTVNVPYAGFTVTKKANEVWKIYEDSWWENALTLNGFFGGHAVLKMKIGTTEQQFHFRIGGKNPDDNKCKAHITAQQNAGPSGALWFAYAVAKHESKGKNTAAGTDIYNQFYELPRHTRDVGFPTWNPDDPPSAGGYGVFQVTGDVNGSHINIPRRQIWNWQDNVTAALVLLADKRRQAVNWMQKPASSPGARPPGQRPQTVFDTGGNVPVPDEARTNITFTDNAGGHPIEDACTIKLYNGDGGTGHYCAWNNVATPKVWKFNRTRNGDGKNYVELVCQEIK
jgi:hypothetical protein